MTDAGRRPREIDHRIGDPEQAERVAAGLDAEQSDAGHLAQIAAEIGAVGSVDAAGETRSLGLQQFERDHAAHPPAAAGNPDLELGHKVLLSAEIPRRAMQMQARRGLRRAQCAGVAPADFAGCAAAEAPPLWIGCALKNQTMTPNRTTSTMMKTDSCKSLRRRVVWFAVIRALLCC